MVAVPFQVYRITGSTLAVGLLALCELVPLLVLSVIGGAVADRVDRRRLLQVTYGVLPVFSIVLALNARLGHPHLWVLYAFATLSTAAYALYSPAVRSTPPLLFPKEELPAVFALTSVYYTFGSLVGPAVAGVLIATIELPGTYLVDAATFLLALWTLTLMESDPPGQAGGSAREVPRHPAGGPSVPEGQAGPPVDVHLRHQRDGVRHAHGPVPGRRGRVGRRGQDRRAPVRAPYGGAFFLTLFSGRAKHVRRQGQAVMASIVVWGAALIAFGLSKSLWLALLMLAVAGGADMWSGIFRTTIAQATVPDAMRGRLSGIELAVVATGPALGDLEAGVVGSLAGVPFAIVSGGIACIAGVFVLGLLVPEFGRYDAAHPTP